MKYEINLLFPQFLRRSGPLSTKWSGGEKGPLYLYPQTGTRLFSDLTTTEFGIGGIPPVFLPPYLRRRDRMGAGKGEGKDPFSFSLLKEGPAEGIKINKI